MQSVWLRACNGRLTTCISGAAIGEPCFEFNARVIGCHRLCQIIETSKGEKDDFSWEYNN